MPPSSPLSGMNPQPPSPAPVTAASVANSWFQAELDSHDQGNTSDRPTNTTVILHDSCYGHRYSRPRTSRASLSTIVERPERIHASVLGIAAAYVRLGDRHAEGQHPPHPKKDPKLVPYIPFRIRKSSRSVPLSSPIVTQVHGAKWMAELTAMCEAAESKLALNGKELARPEAGQAVDEAPKPKLHEGDLYLCKESLDALQGCIGAVCEGVDRVFQGGTSDQSRRAFVCIRPPGHHCSSNYPSGFCWLNNVHVGVAHASMAHGLTHAAIIDFDLHHGDGSQSIAWAHNAKVARLPKNAANFKKTSIGYFSLHDINSYPCEMGDEDKVRNASICVENAHGQTVWNVHLQPWKTEAEFWELYESRYSLLVDKARSFLRMHTDRLRSSASSPTPKAAIFVSAGFDASEWEGAGMQRHKVNVPTDFYARMTQDLVRLAEEDGLGADGRIVSVLEGGYSDRALTSGVLSHLSGLASTYQTGGVAQGLDPGLAQEMGKRIGLVNGDVPDDRPTEPVASFDTAWWGPHSLEELEALANPPPPPPAPKKPRNVTPTYSSPTQSFTAKITSHAVHRSFSTGASNGSPRSTTAGLSRPVSPPPPAVSWATSAHELSKLLVPSDRVTRSCKPEELSVEASRVKRERHSSIGLPNEVEALTGKHMTLRDRKSRAPSQAPPEPNKDESTIPSKPSRRKTLSDPTLLVDDGPALAATKAEGFKQPTNQSRRRMSIASSVGSVGDDMSAVSQSDMTSSNGRSAVASGAAASQMRARPGSSMSVKANGNIVAKSARSSSKARADAARTRPTKKSIPIAIAPAPISGTVPEGPAANTTAAVVPDTEKSVLPDGNGKNGDVESLTSGIKKIKLNLGPKPEHDAKDKEKKKPSVRTTKKDVPSKAASKPLMPRPVQAKKDDSAPAAPAAPASHETTKAPSTPFDPVSKQASSVSREISNSQESDNNAPSLPTNHEPTPAPNGASVPQREFIPYEVQLPLAAPEIKQEPLVWLPPNTSTPSPAKRGDLPVFTANSPIPFGLPRGSSTTVHNVGQNQPTLLNQQVSMSAQPSGLDDAMSSTMKPIAGERPNVDGPVEDMWAVPDTPQR